MADRVENNEEIKIYDTYPPNPVDQNWLDYIDNLPFKSDERVTTFADKLLALNTAIIAAYIAGLKLTNVILTPYVFGPIIFFVLSLLCSLYTIYPRTAKGKFYDLHEIRKRYLKGIFFRRKAITLSLICYFLGMLFGILILLLAS
jgi:hypothetical protein